MPAAPAERVLSVMESCSKIKALFPLSWLVYLQLWEGWCLWLAQDGITRCWKEDVRCDRGDHLCGHETTRCNPRLEDESFVMGGKSVM